jgi:hypothetical protein
MRAAVPVRPPRDLRLDVLRGWMQVSIFISHAGTAFAWGIHAAWGVSDSSEQFVLLSGLVLSSVFSLKWARDGFGPASQDLGQRIRRLWVTHMAVFVAFGAMVVAFAAFTPLKGVVEDGGWGWLAREPWLAVPAGLAGLYQPHFMDVLPLFLCCMLMLPGFLWLLARFGGVALVLPFGLYVVTQIFGLRPIGLGGTAFGFDPLAWQVLFMTGAWLGWRALHGAAPLPRPAWAVGLALAIVGLGFWIKLGVHGFVPLAPAELLALTDKGVLAPIRLAHALSLAWLVAILVPREARWMHHPAAQAMATIGRHSLQVFCVGLFLSYVCDALFTLFPAQKLVLELALIPAGILLLLAFARWRDGQRAPVSRSYSVATARSQ